MPTKVIMPSLGESVVEGTITKWLKSKGDAVEEYEPLLEINTDKVDSEIPSPASGVLLDILASEGATIQAGTLLAWIGERDESPGESEPPTRVDQPLNQIAPETGEEIRKAQMSFPASLAPQPGRDRDLGFISPVVARIAGENNIDLYQIEGTGQGRRITKKDVLAYLEQRKQPAAPQVEPTKRIPEHREPAPKLAETHAQVTQPVPSPAPGEIMPLNTVRRAIAEHMVHSKHTSPHVTTVMEADLSRVVAHREANKADFSQNGVNLTYTAYFMAATVAGLKAYPIVNSSWSDEGIIIHREVNIGMATSLGEAGLIVPVLKNADGLSLLGLARAVNDLANRARARQLKPDEVKGGTFTITNHGVTNSLFATPIINQPQCGIIGIGAIQKRVVVINDAIAIRSMAYLTLTFDHRILDGAIADHFLGKVVEYLQNWT